MSENICKNCEHWNPSMVANEKDNYKPCTNSYVFTGKPKSLHNAREVIQGDLKQVLIPNFERKAFLTGNEDDYILTGENFGCIHFTKRI